MSITARRRPLSSKAPSTATTAGVDTGAGVKVPNGWSVVPLGALCSLTNGVNADKSAYGEGVPFINVLEVITHTHIHELDIPGRVRLRKSLLESFAVRRGDVLFNRTSETQEEVGLSAVYDDDATVVFGGFVIRGRFFDDSVDSTYAGYGFRAPSVRIQIVAQGQGAIRANIGQANLKRVLIPVPPKHEQRAIAEALSDVDGLLGALEGLIAKKRAIKQAAMQQLLTGKIRLPGFSENTSPDEQSTVPSGWQVKSLHLISLMHGRIGWQGLSQAEFTTSPEDPFLITGVDFKRTDIDWDVAYHVSRERYDMAPQIQLRPGDVLMTKDGTIGKMLYVREIPYPGMATLNSHLLVFRPINASYAPRFLLYQMSSRRFLDHIEEHKSGSTFFGLSQAATGRFMVLLPPIEEQHAIATVLSDLDAEIAALERRRDKTQAIKQGMMQQLLTGRVRLVKPQHVEANV